MGGFVRVGKVSDVQKGRGRLYEIDGVDVVVFRTDDGLVAVADTCPHMGASLADGRIVDGAIECSWHQWRFDPVTGKSDKRDWACVAVYQVRIDGEDLLLCPPTSPPSAPEEAPDDDEEWLRWDVARYFRSRETDGDEGNARGARGDRAREKARPRVRRRPSRGERDEDDLG